MMTVRGRGVVVVGVDDSPEAREAAHYAAQLARDRGLDLVVAHAYNLSVVPPISADVIVALREDGQNILNKVVSALEAAPSLRVETLLDLNSPILMLRKLTEVAEVVVLGHHHVGLGERLLLGSIAGPVAAKSRCPVVIVPAGWTPRPSSDRPVVVALDGETAGSAALEYAFSEAERTRTSLLALHAMATETPTEGAEDEVRIAELLAGWKQDHPDTAVSTRVVPGDARDVIVEESDRASVLVVGRPHSGGRFGSWTWSVARAVLDGVSCPLVVVPHDRDDSDLGERQTAALTSSR